MSCRKLPLALFVGVTGFFVSKSLDAQFVPNTEVGLDYVDFVDPAWTVKYHLPPNIIQATSGSPFIFTYPSTVPAGLGGTTLITFCIDPLGYLPETPPATPVSYTVRNLEDYTPVAGNSTKQVLLERLYGYVFGGGYSGSLTTYDPLQLTALERAAFQLTLWELTYDTNYNLDKAAGQSSGFWLYGNPSSGDNSPDVWNARDLAESNFLTTILDTNYAGPTLQLQILDSPDFQDQVVVIPEASTWAAVFAGASLAAVLLIRHRRRVLV